jgi:transcriptional regulator with XRE-family HTH domain
MQTETAPKHPIRPTDLAAKMGWSVPYASQVLTDTRPPTIATALKVLDETGIKLGPIKEASDAEIALLRKYAVAA